MTQDNQRRQLVEYRCPHCGGDHVGHDATSRFNPITQAWELGSQYDDTWCNDCGETSLDTVVLEGEALQALHEQIAAHQAEQRLRGAADDLLAALEKAAWFIENADSLPDRTARFFETREAWRAAIAKASATMTTEV